MKSTILVSIAVSLLNGTCALELFCQTDAAGAPGGHEHILPAKQSSLQANSHDTDPGQDRAAEVIIAGGDLLEINLFGTDFSCGHEKGGCEARVSASGNIVLPLIGSVKLAGLTVAEAEQVIAVRLSQGDFYNDPQVTIAQKEYASQGISVGGEVQKPGIYSLLGPHTLPQAILAAGGTTVKAGNDVTIVRHGTSQHIDLKSPSSSSIRLAPGDTIVVSKAGIVYVVGDVHQPAGIVMESSGLTVLQAIAMAQGTNSTASLDKAKVIRRSAKGRYEIPISLHKILSSKAADLQLQAEDILFIPNSAARTATRRGLEAILQVATGVVIYRR